MQSSLKNYALAVAVGDRIVVSAGEHAGKSGIVVSTRGAHMHNFIFVQLDQIVQGKRAQGRPHPSYRIGIPIRHVDKQ
jgi:ribosomal protein L24